MGRRRQQVQDISIYVQKDNGEVFQNHAWSVDTCSPSQGGGGVEISWVGLGMDFGDPPVEVILICWVQINLSTVWD